jgi:hypothetical protein
VEGNEILNNDVVRRRAVASDLDTVLRIERLACGSDEEATLARNLANDTSAEPVVSLPGF